MPTVPTDGMPAQQHPTETITLAQLIMQAVHTCCATLMSCHCAMIVELQLLQWTDWLIRMMSGRLWQGGLVLYLGGQGSSIASSSSSSSSWGCSIARSCNGSCRS
jgi:hypothetical protein